MFHNAGVNLYFLAFLAHLPISTLTTVHLDNIYSTCFQVPHNLCYEGTAQVLTVPASSSDLIASWSFDYRHPVDESTYGNNLHPTLNPGPSFNGGSSLSLKSDLYTSAPASSSMQYTDMTISFWIYLVEDCTGSDRMIMYQGDQFSVQINKSRGIDLKVDGSVLSAKGSIVLRRWTSVIGTVHNGVIRLYINGIEDGVTTNLNPGTKKGDFVIGANKLTPSFEGYIDEVKLYNRALSISETNSFVLPGITGITNSVSMKLGCQQCTFDTALSPYTCAPPYKLCNKHEMYSMGMHTARIQGWLSRDRDTWFAGMVPRPAQKDETRLAVCCYA